MTIIRNRKRRGVTKFPTSISLDSELRGRLQNVSCGEYGGISAIAEACIRAYLPVYEHLHAGQAAETKEEALIDAMLRPEFLGKALAVALRELLQEPSR